MIEVKRGEGRLVVGGLAVTFDEARDLVHRLWEAIPVDLADDGTSICPKCGIAATEDEPGFWVCEVIECDGYHQTVHDGE